MKQSIIKITLFAFTISAIAILYTHQEACGMEVNRLAAFCRNSTSTQIDNDGIGDNVNNSNVYTNNDNSSNADNNHFESSISADDKIYAHEGTMAESVESSNSFNQNPSNNVTVYNEEVNTSNIGPNNNEPELESVSISNTPQSISNEKQELNSSNTVNSSNEMDASSKEINSNINSSFGPISPGGGTGQDPFSVPLDNYYALALLLLTASVFGIFGLKKMR